jgi:hypothetical protein
MRLVSVRVTSTSSLALIVSISLPTGRPMIEVIKTIGAFVGLLTAIVYFYDRMAKGRPIASLTITRKNERKLACIRISNPSSYDIAVLTLDVCPPVYSFAEDVEVRSFIMAAAGKVPYFMLKPGEDKELVLAPNFKDNRPLDLTPQRIKVQIVWRRGNATWLPQVPVYVWIVVQFHNSPRPAPPAPPPNAAK